MAELTEIPLDLQLKEANRQITEHTSKGRKYQQFLSPAFLRCFPAIMENQISEQVYNTDHTMIFQLFNVIMIISKVF